MSEALSGFVQLVLEEAISVLVSILLVVVATWVGHLIGLARQQLGEKRWGAIVNAVKFAVYAAEQSGLAGHIENVGEIKKQYAIAVAQEFLAEKGLSLDLTRLMELIEAELAVSVNYYKVLPDAKRV